MHLARTVIVPVMIMALAPDSGRRSAIAEADSLAPVVVPDSVVAGLTGIYRSMRNPTQDVWIASLGRGVLQVRCGEACYSVGFWDGHRFRGVLRPSFDASGGPATDPEGDLRFEIATRDTLRALIRFAAAKPPLSDTWVRRATAPGDPGPEPDAPPVPKIGDYVYVEELPEVLTRVPPDYPEMARKKQIEGTVLVQALVGRDGRVKETKVLSTTPGNPGIDPTKQDLGAFEELSAAAEAAVRQWLFKPALAKGAPVAVWIAVPVKFTLK